MEVFFIITNVYLRIIADYFKAKYIINLIRETTAKKQVLESREEI